MDAWEVEQEEAHYDEGHIIVGQGNGKVVTREDYQKIEADLMILNDISKTEKERADAAYKIAEQFIYGDDVSVSDDLAVYFLEQASKLNHEGAAHILWERKRTI